MNTAGLLHLRALEESDLPSVLRWENDESAWRYGDTVAPLSGRMMRDYIASYMANPFGSGELRLAIEEKSTGQIVGLADFYRINAVHSTAFVGIYIDADCRCSGYGLEAVGLMEEFAAAFLGLRQLCACISADNLASMKVFEKGGYARCGCLPQWRRSTDGFCDVAILVKRIN